MKKYLSLIFILVLLSCSGTKSVIEEKPLVEILTNQSDGGGNLHFYEILSEQNEIMMLLSDEHLKKKIKKEDTLKSNFVILNMGEKPSGGYQFKIVRVEETNSNIILYVQELEPNKNETKLMETTYPYCVVKINSKKPIIFK
jgi:hypothetical protein